MQQSIDDSWQLVLSLVLSNTKPWPLHDLCQLLCTSRATADAVHTSCAGDIEPPCFSTNDLQQPGLIGWLGKHAVLLRRLQHDDECSPGQDDSKPWSLERYPTHAEIARAANRQAASEQLAAALAAAGTAAAVALPGGLMLQSLSTYSPRVLRAGSCRMLTALELSMHEDLLFPSAQETTDSITSLASQLLTLNLHVDWLLFDSTTNDGQVHVPHFRKVGQPGCGLRSLLQQALPQLTVLTSLEVEQVADAFVLTYAPPQLQELVVVGVGDPNKNALDLGHLTALTSLDFQRSPQEEQEAWRKIQPDDTLPPNLRALFVCNCMSATPLLRLTALEELSVAEHCRMPVRELQRLSAMTQLQDVWLRYKPVMYGDFADSAEEGSAGWGYVPALHDLELHEMCITPGCSLLQELAALTQLTRLVWQHSWFGRGDFLYKDRGLSAFGDALPDSLLWLSFAAHLSADEAVDNGEAWVVWGVRQLKGAIQALPNLVVCSFEDTSMNLSDSGEKLVHMLLGSGLQEPVPDEWFLEPVPDEWAHMFDAAYPGFWDDMDSEPGSEGEGDEGVGGEEAEEVAVAAVAPAGGDGALDEAGGPV